MDIYLRRLWYVDGDFELVGKHKDESASWTCETLYEETIDYEKGILKYTHVTNFDMLDKESPVYEEGEKKIERISNFERMSEKNKWESYSDWYS